MICNIVLLCRVELSNNEYMCNEVMDLVSNFTSEQRLRTFTYKCSMDISSKLCLLYLISCMVASPFWIFSGANIQRFSHFWSVTSLGLWAHPSMQLRILTTALLLKIFSSKSGIYYVTLASLGPTTCCHHFYNYLVVLKRHGLRERTLVSATFSKPQTPIPT